MGCVICGPGGAACFLTLARASIRGVQNFCPFPSKLSLEKEVTESGMDEWTDRQTDACDTKIFCIWKKLIVLTLRN